MSSLSLGDSFDILTVVVVLFFARDLSLSFSLSLYWRLCLRLRTPSAAAVLRCVV